MKKERIISVFFITAALIVTASRADPAAETGFPGEWKYALGERDDTITDARGKTYRKLDGLTDLHLKHPDREGFLWIKAAFRLSDRLKNRPCAFLLGRIIMADETYLNGVLIGKSGRFPPGVFSEWNKTRHYEVPSELFRDEGENVLLIKLYVNYEGSITGKIMLGESDAVHHEYVKQDFINSRINALISFLMAMIAFYHLLIFFLRTRDRENLYYSLVCLIFAFYLTNFYITRMPGFDYTGMSYLFFQKLIIISMFIIVYFFARFLQEYLGIEEDRYATYILRGATILPALVLLFLPDYRYFMKIRFPLTLFLLVHIFYIIYITVRSAIQRKAEARILLIGSVPLYAGVLFDIIAHNILQLNNFIYLTGLGFPSFLIVIAGILASRFVQYHNEVEELNISLEHKVEERTSELRRTNEVLQNTMEELQEAQAIAEKDMRMAVNVQESILPAMSPAAGWDSAFQFQPMAGVSGDFYDFYYEDGELKGAGLFDVSGHGISSGLITIMAKSIIFRHFCEHRHDSPGKTLDAVNEDLVQELVHIDNYLTGILLQFNGNTVEYANAAHTELLMKRSDSAQVRAVNRQDRDFRGMVLGVPEIRQKHTTLKFTVNRGDMLLLYSDCLLEQKNSEKEEYGMDRLMKAFQTAPNKSAGEVLEHIIESFHAFRGEEPMADDLTAIVLGKL